MDISKLISVSCVPTGGFGSQDEEEAEDGGLGEVHSRDLLYKRRGIKFSGNTKENRALRHIRVSTMLVIIFTIIITCQSQPLKGQEASTILLLYIIYCSY